MHDYATSGPATTAQHAQRSTTVVAVEVLGLGCLMTTTPLVTIWALGGRSIVLQIVGSAPALGAVLLDHIGWGLGCHLAVLLGFYALIISSQLSPAAQLPASTRRRLGTCAELLTATLVPSFVLLISACLDEPTRAGVLVVAVPVAITIFFLAIQLGSFNAFDREERLRDLEKTRSWASSWLASSGPVSSRPLWQVAAGNALAGVIIGLLPVLLFGLPAPALIAAFQLHATIAPLLVAASLLGVARSLGARNWADHLIAWLCLLPIAGSVLHGATAAAATNPVAAMSLGAVVLLNLASTYWPRSRSPRLVLDWSLRGSGAQLARHLVRDRLHRANADSRTPAPARRDSAGPARARLSG